MYGVALGIDTPRDSKREWQSLAQNYAIVAEWLAEHVRGRAASTKVITGAGSVDEDQTEPAAGGQRRICVYVETAVVEIDGTPYGLNGTQTVKQRVADFMQQLVEANGEYVPRPNNIKTRNIEAQPEAVRDLVDAQSGAGSRILRDKIWRS